MSGTTPVAGCQFALVTGFTERANGMPTHTAVLMGYTRVGWAPPPVVSPIIFCPAQRLQRVAEVLPAGERPAAGQHVDRPVEVAAARHVGQGPELLGLSGVGVEDVVEVRGPLVEQVAAPEDHARRARRRRCGACR